MMPYDAMLRDLAPRDAMLVAKFGFPSQFGQVWLSLAVWPSLVCVCVDEVDEVDEVCVFSLAV